MKNTVIINKEFVLGAIEKDVWGSFIEHMGRAVYDGIYEPAHPLADEQGFRKDVMDAVRALHVPKVRYPGGNFLSGYDWRDGIGKDRPVRLDLAWGQLETNEVGLHEFCGWAEKVGAEVMMSVNMGTGTPKDAAQLVEYCNHEKGTAISDLRRRNGREKPFGIRTWCIGNEMDGDWQICALTAEEYGRKAAETAKMMRWVDHDIELVVCGSSTPDQKTYPEWDRIVLQHTYDYVDYLSMHRYYTYPDDTQNVTDFLSSHTDFDAFIKTVASAADYVKAYTRSRKVMKISSSLPPTLELDRNMVRPLFGSAAEHGEVAVPVHFVFAAVLREETVARAESDLAARPFDMPFAAHDAQRFAPLCKQFEPAGGRNIQAFALFSHARALYRLIRKHKFPFGGQRRALRSANIHMPPLYYIAPRCARN